jgi:uncharacterized membrane protein
MTVDSERQNQYSLAPLTREMGRKDREMAKTYAEHHASVTVNAPVNQVYSLFSHFNDFPKFMSFVKEVTYYDDQKSHWVAEVVGRHEWDAVNEDWIPDKQIGWHSTKGLDNFGRVTFEPATTNQTKVDVYINYDPPAGVLGDLGEKAGAGKRFEEALQNDLNNFARMVDQAPAGALDPTSSNYLFHAESAAAQGKTTERQNETMYDEPNLRQKTPGNPPIMDKDITNMSNQDLASQEVDYGSRPTDPQERQTPPQERRTDIPPYNRDLDG